MTVDLPKPYRVSVVVQTHWDREWYFPQQTFASRLIAVMERVCDQLDDGRLQHFLFDGQVCALEDLLDEAEPALRERVLAHARAGRIALGPWYVMADEFLVSGESLWRNLEIGLSAAAAYGRPQRIGYLPDSFGHIAQMPQILRRLGIPTAVTWRGIDLRHAEFRWQAPDGSTVDALYLTQGYYQHPLNVPGWDIALTRYLEAIAPRSLSSTLLLTQGGDHLAPHGALAQRIDDYNAGQQRYQLVQHSLQQHLEALGGMDRPTLIGELRDNVQSLVLPDVLSTRRYLKHAHQRLEDRLLGETEPLWAWLRGVEPPAHALERSWKLLIQQQAHDSICGCSVDAVHDEMEARLQSLDQRLQALRGRALHAAGLQTPLQHEGDGVPVFADDHEFTLFNPLPLAADGWQPVSLLLQGPLPAAVRVLRSDGIPVPVHWLGCESERSLRSPLDDFPEPVIGHRLHLRLQLAIQGLEAVTLHVEACEPKTPGAALLATEELLDRRLAVGGLALDEAGQLWWQDRLQLALHTELDAGDSYNFSPPPAPARQWQRHFHAVALRRSGPFTQLTLGYGFEQAARLDESRQGPSSDVVHTHGRLTLLMTEGTPWIEAQLTHHTDAQDQRTRLVFAAGETLTECAADTAFHWTRRPVRKAAYPGTAVPQREMPVAVNPTLSAVQAGAVAVVHRGLQEFEIIDGPDGRQSGDALALTLQRAVGWLSRRDLVTRGAGAGPDLPTPGAQRGFDGTTTLAFCLDGSLTPDAVLQQALRLRRPLLVLPGHRATAWREPLTLQSHRLIPSSLRRVGVDLELRLWNALDQALPGTLPGWTRVGSDDTLVRPHQIATYRRPA